MAFELACTPDDVLPDEALAVSIGDLEIAIARRGDTFYALQDLCSHAQVALSEGEVEVYDGACSVECWLHGSRFNVVTGAPSGPPATDPVATFAVEVRTTPDGPAIFVDTSTTLNGVTPA